LRGTTADESDANLKQLDLEINNLVYDKKKRKRGGGRATSPVNFPRPCTNVVPASFPVSPTRDADLTAEQHSVQKKARLDYYEYVKARMTEVAQEVVNLATCKGDLTAFCILSSDCVNKVVYRKLRSEHDGTASDEGDT
jgi:hypothetical protein